MLIAPAVNAATARLGKLIDIKSSAESALGSSHNDGLHVLARVGLTQAIEKGIEDCM